MAAAREDGTAISALANAGCDAAPDGIRTLVVDDSAAAMEAVCGLIELEPWVEIVGRAGNGVEAIAAVATLEPELVIMDVNMPYLDGLKTSAILTSHYPDLSVLLISAEESEQLREAGRRHGAHALLSKHHLIHGLPVAIRELFPDRV
jgi:DNA-binding NarL/FixJ family response regulator